MKVRVSQIVESTRAEGPGIRFAVWLQGCPLRCPGCCNPEMLSFKGGTECETADLFNRIVAAKRRHGIEGITLLGGEPFAHAAAASELASGAQRQGLSVMVFTGFTLAELRARQDAAVDALIANTDLMIDGPYLRDQPDSSRRWIGSENQNIHFLSHRYTESDQYWSEPDTLEIRIHHGEILVNGFPAASAKEFWRRPNALPGGS